MRVPRIQWSRLFAAIGCGIGFTTLGGELLSGGSFRLVGGPVSGGGVVSGGSLTLDATAGELTAGLMQGGALEIIGTLHSVVEVVVGEIVVAFVDLGDGRVRIEWPASAAGYVLESTPSLNDPVPWSPVAPSPAGNTHIITTSDANQFFFRLRKD